MQALKEEKRPATLFAHATILARKMYRNNTFLIVLYIQTENTNSKVIYRIVGIYFEGINVCVYAN